MNPTARDMANAIWGNTQKLFEANILDYQSSHAASQLRNSLMKKGNSKEWEIRVSRENGFVFKECVTDKGVRFRPTVSVDRIATQATGKHPFSSLDVSLDIACIDDKNHARWHFDLANAKELNKFQDGPTFHMQFGGHVPGRDSFWLNRPRWAHAPMDLILLLEIVAANFYPKEWSEHLRELPSWCANITQSEKLCLTAYVENLQNTINNSSQTVLGTFWANPS